MTEKEISIQITRYINGELTAKEEDQLWVEFLKDPQRFRHFETELNLYDLFQNKGYALSEKDRVDEPKRKYNSWIFAAAAALLLVSSLYIFFNISDSGTEALAVSEIELSELLGSDVYRDDNSNVDGIDYEINNAIASALDGKLTQAYQILDDLTADSVSNQNKQRIHFNQGVIAYNNGDYSLSVAKFSKLTDTEHIPEYLEETACWYKANGYLKLNDEKNAVEALQQVIAIDDHLSEKARSILRRLESL